MKLKKGTEIDVEIQYINIAGKGIVKVDGINLAVDRTFPGDKARVMITKSKKSYAEGRVVKLTKPSKLRVRPQSISGGSPWECISYENQLEFKQLEVERLIKNTGAKNRTNSVYAVIAKGIKKVNCMIIFSFIYYKNAN